MMSMLQAGDADIKYSRQPKVQNSEVPTTSNTKAAARSVSWSLMDTNDAASMLHNGQQYKAAQLQNNTTIQKYKSIASAVGLQCSNQGENKADALVKTSAKQVQQTPGCFEAIQ